MLKEDIINKKICFLLIAYWHDYRWRRFVGATVKIWDLADNLSRLGHNVILFLPRYGFKKENLSFNVVEIPIINIPVLRPIIFSILLFIKLMLKHINNKLAIIYMRRTFTFIPLVFAKIKKIPFFFEVNDDPYKEKTDKKGIRGLLRDVLAQKIDELNIKMADRIIVISRGIKEKILRYNPHILKKKIHCIPSGANIHLFKPMEKKSACSRIGLEEKVRYVGFVGTLLPHQGVEVLVSSAKEISKFEPDVKFIVVGEGPIKARICEKIKRMNLKDKFILTGEVDYELVPYWIGAMDVCVSPYIRSAGIRSPVKIFDYLACGRPVVASLIKGTTDIFEESGAVELIEPESPKALSRAIVSLLNNPAKAKEMGMRGRKWIEKRFDRFNWAKKISDEAISMIFRYDP